MHGEAQFDKISNLIVGSLPIDIFCGDPESVRYLLVEAYSYNGQILNNEEWLQKMASHWKLDHDTIVKAYQATVVYMSEFMESNTKTDQTATISMNLPVKIEGIADFAFRLITDKFNADEKFTIVGMRNLQAACLFANLIMFSMQNGTTFIRSE